MKVIGGYKVSETYRRQLDKQTDRMLKKVLKPQMMKYDQVIYWNVYGQVKLQMFIPCEWCSHSFTFLIMS